MLQDLAAAQVGRRKGEGRASVSWQPIVGAHPARCHLTQGPLDRLGWQIRGIAIPLLGSYGFVTPWCQSIGVISVSMNEDRRTSEAISPTRNRKLVHRGRVVVTGAAPQVTVASPLALQLRRAQMVAGKAGWRLTDYRCVFRQWYVAVQLRTDLLHAGEGSYTNLRCDPDKPVQ